MQVAVFFVPFADGASELDALNSFLRGHRVLKVDHALVDGGWAFCVEWLEGENGLENWKRKPRVNWREKLEPGAFARFAALRERRKEIASQEGIPPYMIMTDAQMADAAKPEVLTLDDLRKIDGFGDARIRKYGDKLIKTGDVI